MQMEYQELVNRIVRAVSSNEMIRNFKQGYANVSNKTVRAMIRDIDAATGTTDDIFVDPQVLNDVKAVIRDTLNMVILEPLNKFQVEFIDMYCLLALNWSRLAKDESLTRDIKSIVRVRNMVNDTETLIKSVKMLTDKVNRLYQRNPPYFQVSQHYLNTIKRALQK